jgi:hypothetical protein
MLSWSTTNPHAITQNISSNLFLSPKGFKKRSIFYANIYLLHGAMAKSVLIEHRSKTVRSSIFSANDYTVGTPVENLFNAMQQNGGTNVQYARLIVSVPNENIDLGTTYQASTSLQTVQHQLNELKQVYTNIVVANTAAKYLVMYKRGEGIKPIFLTW